MSCDYCLPSLAPQTLRFARSPLLQAKGFVLIDPELKRMPSLSVLTQPALDIIEACPNLLNIQLHRLYNFLYNLNMTFTLLLSTHCGLREEVKANQAE